MKLELSKSTRIGCTRAYAKRVITAALAAVICLPSFAAGEISGDINGDGKVNSKDLTRLMRILAGDIEAADGKLTDTNGDGSFNSKDLTRLMKFLAGEDVILFGGSEEAKEDIEIYVDPLADEDGKGTKEEPYSSVELASAAIRKLKAEEKVPKRGSIKVILGAGTEYAPEALAFTKEDSGTADCPVIYISEGEEPFTLDGGALLEYSGFIPADDEFKSRIVSEQAREKLLSYDLGAAGLNFEAEGIELYINGERGLPARYPNEGYITGFEGNEYSGDAWNFTDTENRVATWKSLSGVTVEGNFETDWVQNSGSDLTYNPASNTVSMKTKANTVNSGGRYYYSRIPDEIDVPGEYYIDRTAGRLYVYPTEDFETAGLRLSQCPSFLVSGELDYCTFEGITFENSAGGLISLTGNGLAIKNCTVRASAGDGIVIAGDDTYIYGNEVCVLGGLGISVDGGDERTLKHSGNVVENNSVHNYAIVRRTYVPGITAFGVGCDIIHNEIYNAPHNAINYTACDVYMEYNYIHNVCYEANDAGAIYDGGWTSGGVVFRNNIIKDIVNNTPGSEWMRPNGYYCDDCGGGKTVVSNIFINVGGNAIKFGGGRDNIIEDNIMIGCNLYYDQRSYYGGWTFPTKYSGGLWKGLFAAPSYGSELWAMSFPWTSVIKTTGVIDRSDRYIAQAFGNTRICRNVVYTIGTAYDIQPDTKRLCTVRDNITASSMEYFEFADYEGGDYTVAASSGIYYDNPGFDACDWRGVGIKN